MPEVGIPNETSPTDPCHNIIVRFSIMAVVVETVAAAKIYKGLTMMQILS